MLSRVIFARPGGVSSLLSGDVHGRFATALSVIRFISNTTPVAAHAPKAAAAKQTPPDDPNIIAKTLADWEAAHNIYFGPQRDLVNFPIKKCPETNPPVRLGFIPESWFAAMYEKTGVTGPYVFGSGVIISALSKEYWLVEHGFFHFVSFWLAFYILLRKLGPAMGKYFDTVNTNLENRQWFNRIDKTKKEFKENIEELEKSIWREEGQKYIFEAKRENVDLQLENAYRARLNEAYTSVKKRLDYAVDVENSKRRLQQEHMVQWIVDSVQKGITPQQEKDSLAKCIQDLKSIAARHATA